MCEIASHGKCPASRKVRRETPTTTSLALGANRETKEKVKGNASRMQINRIGSALVCVRRNAYHRKLNLPESTRFVPVTLVMVVTLTNGPSGRLLILQ